MSFPVSRGFSKLLATLAAIFCAASASADNSADTIVRPVTAAYTLEIGSSHLCDTYLTPLHYSGWATALGYERSQALKFAPATWTGVLDARLKAGRTLNPAHTAAMWDIDFHIAVSMLRRWQLPGAVSLAIGPCLEGRVGALSLMRNGNNPVSARAAITAGITARATWKTQLGRLPITMFTRPSMPLIGAFFSPDYDELYYEIWLGNRAGLVHCAWPGSYFHLDNLLGADLHFGATTLRIGYRLDLRSSKVADITTRTTAHTFVLGICSDWISLRSRATHTPDAAILQAY